MANNNKDVHRGIVLYLDGKQVDANAQNIQREMRKVKREIDKCTIGSEEYVAATRRYRELNGILQEHRRSLGQVADANRQAKLAGQSYAEQVMSMLGLNSRFGASLSSLGQGKAAFSNLTTAASAFTKTMLGLLTNPVFLAIAGIGGTVAAFKFWYDYNKGLAEATRLTREFLNVSGDELVTIRSDIQALADAYGKDYKTVLQSVDTLTSQYGISAQQALSVIRDGFIAGADESGNFLSQLSKYAPAFHDIGINAQELTALISQTRSGIFSEQGMSSIQMAGKRIREMSTEVQSALQTLNLNPEEITKGLQEGSITTFDVIRQISEKMKALDPQSREVGEVLKDVFGKQGAAAGYQLVTAFANVSTSIEECKTQTGEYGQAMEEYLETQSELNNTTAALFDLTQSGFSEMTIQLKTIATKWLISMMKGIIDIVNWFIELYNKSTAVRISVAAIRNNFTALWAAAKVVVNNLILGFKNVGVVLGGLLDALENVASLNFADAKDALTKMFSDVANNVKSSIDYTRSTMVDMFTDNANAISDAVNNRVNPITIPVRTEGEDSSGSSGTGGGGSSGGSGGKGGKNGGKGGGSSNTESQRIKAETQAIQVEIAQRQNILKQQYAQGLIDRQKYNSEMEALEIERIQKLLQIAGLEPEKVTELQGKLQDIALKAREALDSLNVKDYKSGSFEDVTAQTEKLKKAHDEQIATLKRNLQLKNITSEQYHAEAKRIDSQYFLESEALWGEYRDKVASISQEMTEELTDKQKKMIDTFQNVIAPLMESIGTELGEGLANAIRDGEDGVKEALKNILKLIVKSVQNFITAAIVSTTVEGIKDAGFTWGASIAVAAAKVAAISAAGAGLNALIDGWASGGYTGTGGAYEPAGTVHKNEFVANRFALANPAVKSVLDVIDQAQRSGSIANLTSADLQSATAPSAANTPQNDALTASMLAVVRDCTDMLHAVKSRFDQPIIAETYLNGRGGINNAINEETKILKNSKR